MRDGTAGPVQSARRRERREAAMQAWEAYVDEVRGTAAVSGREASMDRRRQLEAIIRTQEALQARADAQAQEPQALGDGGAARVLLAHRNEWVLERLEAGLTDRGLEVVAQAYDGADAVGLAIVEQPDVVLIEGKLPTKSGLQVVTELTWLAPGSLIGVQAEDVDEFDALLEAGAAAVFARRVPPAEVVDAVGSLLAGGGRPLLLR